MGSRVRGSLRQAVQQIDGTERLRGGVSAVAVGRKRAA